MFKIKISAEVMKESMVRSKHVALSRKINLGRFVHGLFSIFPRAERIGSKE